MKLTQEELEVLQQMNTEYTQIKVSIADLEMQKHSALHSMEALREKFSAYEKVLVDRYGADSVINLKTGEITKKEK